MKKWYRFWLFLVLGVGLVWLAFFSFPEKRLRLVFCDVGQGDGILISRGFWQFLIDGGPDERVLTCLAKNMPFFDKKIEAVAVTHPDSDHLTGVVAVLKNYQVGYLFAGAEGSDSGVYQEFLKVLEEKGCFGKECGPGKIKVRNLYAGENLKARELVLKVIWPEKEFVAERLGDGVIGGDKAVLGAKTRRQTNLFSLVLLGEYKGRRFLLMGDADSEVNHKFIKNITSLPIDILKFPHHGSRNGMKEEDLLWLGPKEVVISAGKNSFGHPAGEVLEMVEKVGARVRRTDKEGEIDYEF